MKYVIEINHEYEDSFKGLMILGAKDSDLYVDTLAVDNIEVLNSEYVNEHFGELFTYHTDIAKGEGMGEMYKAIMQMVDMNNAQRMNAFGMVNTYDIVTNLSPSEFYTKLTAYEQKQKEDAEIKVGDEVKALCGDAVVFETYTDGSGEKACYYFYPNEKRCDHDRAERLTKTGRHFPEIAQLLEKMKGE